MTNCQLKSLSSLPFMIMSHVERIRGLNLLSTYPLLARTEFGTSTFESNLTKSSKADNAHSLSNSTHRISYILYKEVYIYERMLTAIFW